MNNIDSPKWKVLMIGGSSGVGKTVVARELAKQLSIPLLLLDDIRIAIQQVTTFESNPELHIFLNYQAEQWRNSQSIYADWITVGRAMAKPLNAIVDHHIKVPSIGPIIIEGDGILPLAGNQIFEQKDVNSIFIVEQSEEQLLNNLRSRGRGFNDGHELEQKGFAHASWLYGQWLAQEAEKLGLLVINAQPHQTIFERLLSSISNQ
jgi:2-phosphoglycerate kinase